MCYTGTVLTLEALSVLLDSLQKDTSQGYLLSSPVGQLPGAGWLAELPWLGARQGEALVAQDDGADRQNLGGHIGLAYIWKK